MVKDKKKILFIILSLGGGGAERVLLNILKYLNRERFTPYLILFEKKGEYLDWIPEDVVIYDLNARDRVGESFKLISLLAYRIYPKIKPDIIVSFLGYANLIAIMAKKISLIKPPVIISERIYRSMALKYERKRGIKKLLIKILYPQVDKIIVVSKVVGIDLNRSFGVPTERVQIIYNGVDLFFINSLIQEPVDNIPWFEERIPTIIACGNLRRQKNYPLLLRAFAKAQQNSRARLLILGEGEERDSLEKLTHRLGIKDKVIFLGFQRNPFKFITRSTIFVLSSNWEGFPNVITEALACGVPVISTRCPSGPEEIIIDGVNGLLVPVGDVGALAEAILQLLKDEPLRRHLAQAGRKRAEDFRVEKMVAEYEKVFEETIQ